MDWFEHDEHLFSRAVPGMVVRLSEDHEVLRTPLSHPNDFEVGMSFAGGIVFQLTMLNQKVTVGRLTLLSLALNCSKTQASELNRNLVAHVRLKLIDK